MNARCFIVAGVAVSPPSGLEVTNFHDPGVPHFVGNDRNGKPVNEIIIHESVTHSVAETAKVLKRRRLGVHLIVGPDGHLTQHGDLLFDRLAHAGSHNSASIGVEVVNPYYPDLLRTGEPWERVIDAPWAHKRRYVLPTPAQAEAVARLIDWAASPASGLAILRRWIGLRAGKLAMGAVTGAERPAPGIYAHHYVAHADGAWLVLYAWLRLEAGLAAGDAYEEAATRATGARARIDVLKIINAARRKE